MRHHVIWLLAIVCCACQPNSLLIEPNIEYTPSPKIIESLPSAFKPLSPEEIALDWGKELLIATSFAREFDLYRAITGFKRALVLIPAEQETRRWQIEYGVVQCYYLGQKYAEAIEAFETGHLSNASNNFPAFDDLLLILYDSYQKVGLEGKAERVRHLLQVRRPAEVEALEISQALLSADFIKVQECATKNCTYSDCGEFLIAYSLQAKSVKHAQTLNAMLPGAGYAYVGQKKSALTSFLLNVLFTAAAYHFFERGNVAAGLITTSLEMGWYIGGINGAGLAAKEYNERLYETRGKNILLQRRLFPVLMLEKAF